MINYSKVLQAFSLLEIIELNDLTEEDTLQFLDEQRFLTLPQPRPLDFDD